MVVEIPEAILIHLDMTWVSPLSQDTFKIPSFFVI